MANEFLNAYLDGDRVTLLHRSPAGTLLRRQVPAEWVTFFRLEQVAPYMRELRLSRYVLAAVEEPGGWLRVRWRGPDARRAVLDAEGPLAQKGIEAYEGDVGPVRRVMSDHGYCVARPCRCYLDIEADSRTALGDKESARILCWTVEGHDDGRVVQGVLEANTDAAERALLLALWGALDPYDQVCAWYGDGYDFPVIDARSERLGARPKDRRRWLWLDHLVAFKRMHTAESGDEKQSMSLQNIATALLGEGKDAFDASRTWEAWSASGSERERLLRYNAKDVHLLRRIEDRTGYLDLLQTVCEVCRLFASTDALRPTEQMDGFMLRLGAERGLHFPTRHNVEEAEPYAGAFVMEPRARGVERAVHVADFASLYPSIIVAWNMSPDTRRDDVPVSGPLPAGALRAPGTGQAFHAEPVGVLPCAVGALLRMRKEWSNKQAACPPGTPEWRGAGMRSTAYKVVANSFYGVVGSPFSRYHDRAVAEAVTQTGVWLIKRTIELSERRGWRTVYGDTDSVFVQGPTDEEFRAFVRECNELHYPEMVGRTGVPAGQCSIRIAYEKKFERIVFVAAKRYAGRYEHYKGKPATEDSEPEVKGLEYKRGDTAVLARRLQKRVIDMLMHERAEDPTAFVPVLDAARAHVLEEPLPVEECRVSKSLNKALGEYAVRTKNDGAEAASLPHVMLARRLAVRGVLPGARQRRDGTWDAPAGARVDYVVVDASARPMAVVWAPDYDGQPDRHYLWESLVYPATHRLLEAAFPGSGWERWEKTCPPKARTPRGVVQSSGPQQALFEPRPAAPQNVLRPGDRPVVPAAPPVPALVLRVREGAAVNPLPELRRLLVAHPGGSRVVVEVEVTAGVAVLDAPMHAAVTPPLLDALRALLGRDAVHAGAA